MAMELLRAAKRGKVVQHSVSHDLESIALVFGYTVMRHTHNVPGCPDSIRKLFDTFYGGVTVTEIIEHRRDQQPLIWLVDADRDLGEFVKRNVSPAIRQLMLKLRSKIHDISDAMVHDVFVCFTTFFMPHSYSQLVLRML